MSARSVSAQDQLYFSSNTNVTNILVQYINQETVRLDISSWYLSEHSISIAIANRWAAGVPVRIIGDRAAPFENDPHTKAEFYWLANQGIPIRLRFNPTYFPEIDHWKAAIFVGQHMVEFGSGNFAPTELAPVSSTNFDDDSELFTTDPTLVGAFETKFDVIWNDTTTEPHSIISGPPYLKDWNDACAHEPTGNCADYATQYPNPAPMVINTARLEPDNPMPADLYWGQGTEFNARMVQEVNNETSNLDIIIYRLEVSDLTQALLSRFQAGVPLRMIIDPAQYTDNVWPEYWLTHANIDRLYAAGVPILQRTHQGVTHIKTLITSKYATNASSNFAPNWQRDNDYFVSVATKPSIYQAFVDRFNAMWADTTNFGAFVPTPPNAVDTGATGTVPSPGQSGVSVGTSLTWNRASWATSYDVYLGNSPSSMTVVANVPAQLVQNPPTTYSWTPSSALNFSTTYYWKIVSRTFAGLTASSSIQTFSTPSSGSQPPTTPANPTPATATTGVGNAPTLTWSSAGAASFSIKFGTTNPPTSTGTSTTSPSYSPGTLSSNTTYYWQIIATNSAGSTTGPIWSFATSASNLPSPWQSQDVGATGRTGSSTLNAGTFTISGAGSDIWGTADGFQFAYQPLSGNGTIIARVTSMQDTSANAKAGVMLRTSVAANSAHVILDMTPTGNIEFMSRPTTGASTTWLAGTSQAAPVWLQLALNGSTVTGSISTDGETWKQVASTTISFPATIDAGLVVNSHDTSTLDTATFDAVSIANAAAAGVPGSPTPANSATGVSTSPTLTWTSTGASSYDVAFGTSSSPALVSSGQAGASYSPGTLTAGMTYFWQITAHNSAGATAGPTWSFTTAAAQSAPGTPGTPSPGNAATGVATTPTLTWSSSGATSYDVRFGTSNPPSQVVAGQTAASYAPAALSNATTYFWQIVAHNASGTTSGPVWSFTTSAASGLPGPWQNQDVGAVGKSGSASYSGGQFTVSGAGADIWGAADAFQFVYQSLAGDGQVVARVRGLQNTSSNAKAGVMMRESLDASAAHVILDVEPSGNIEFMTRGADGGQTSWLAGATQTPPVFLRLSRAGSTVTGDISMDGQTWTTVGSTTITLPASADVGLIVTSHSTSTLNTATFDSVAVSASNTAPGAPGSPSPANSATAVSPTPTLTWNASGATSYDVAFGTSNPPTQVTTGQSAASYSPAALSNSTTYYWQITAHNSAGATSGAVWSFTTAAVAAPPGTPGSPSPATGATGTSTTLTLGWSATGATSYDVHLGTTNPPPTVSTAQASASYTPPSALNTGTTYFWQVVAHNGGGTTAGPVWSFTTSATTSPTDIVIYASDVPSNAMHGMWSVGNDSTSPNGVKLITPDNAWAATDAPIASPSNYVDVTFTASAGVPYTLWMRIQALDNNKYNDSLWVQFSDAVVNGSPIYPLNSTSGLDVNLATDSTGSSDQAWGWVNSGYWLVQETTMTFASSGTHTLRLQVREDGVQWDQIVLSPVNFFNASASCPTSCGSAPGAVSNDHTIVPKP
ncbi:MAG TPA: phospholipase D-like domain-containing protein [Vicinamibacterales bacterium]